MKFLPSILTERTGTDTGSLYNGCTSLPKKTFDLAGDDKLLLVQLKDNQKHLLQDVQTLSENTMPCDSYVAQTQYGHGRIANRITQK